MFTNELRLAGIMANSIKTESVIERKVKVFHVTYKPAVIEAVKLRLIHSTHGKRPIMHKPYYRHHRKIC